MAESKNGRAPAESIVGKTSRYWTVIAQAERPEGKTFRGTWWLCRCQCGTEKVFPRCTIVQQSVFSCGCIAPDRRRKTVKPAMEKPKEETPKKRKRNIPKGLSLNFEELAKTTVCYECGKTFERLSNEWAYKVIVKDKRKWFCSWKCQRKAEQKTEKNA